MEEKIALKRKRTEELIAEALAIKDEFTKDRHKAHTENN
jgi:hypothetical protein